MKLLLWPYSIDTQQIQPHLFPDCRCRPTTVPHPLLYLYATHQVLSLSSFRLNSDFKGLLNFGWRTKEEEIRDLGVRIIAEELDEERWNWRAGGGVAWISSRDKHLKTICTALLLKEMELKGSDWNSLVCHSQFLITCEFSDFLMFLNFYFESLIST